MAAKPEVEEIQERKERLIFANREMRRDLTAICDRLHQPAVWIDRGYSFVRRIAPYWSYIGPVLGFVALRKIRRRRPPSRWRLVRPLVRFLVR